MPADLRENATTVHLDAIDDDTRELRVESPHERLVAAARSAVGAS
jgi:hypothetical protein